MAYALAGWLEAGLFDALAGWHYVLSGWHVRSSAAGQLPDVTSARSTAAGDDRDD